MAASFIDSARQAAALTTSNCVLIGEGLNVRLVFIAEPGKDGTAPVLSAVTLSREQLTGFAGMVDAVLDADDPHALCFD